MVRNPLAAAAATHPDLEIWWDSSPLIFDSWRAQVAADASGKPGEARCRERLEGVWDAIVGCTTNPPLTLGVVEADPAGWGVRTDEIIARGARDAHDAFWTLYRTVVHEGSERFRGLFDASGGKLGFLSGQVDPRLLTETAEMVSQGITLHAMNPNIMIKMPGTREGIYGICLLTALGISTNATLVFTMSQILAVAEAVRTGVQLARAAGVDLSAWRSVCTMMLGRYEDCAAFDESAAGAGVTITPELRRWAGVAIFNQAAKRLAEGGYATKLLGASMRVGPTVEGKTRIWHIEKLLGQPVVLTIFPNIVEAWLEHYDGEEMPTAPGWPSQPELETLLRVPYFRVGFEGGEDPSTFASHPAVVVTGEAFIESTRKLENWVRDRMPANP